MSTLRTSLAAIAIVATMTLATAESARAQGAVAFQPVIGTIPEGAILNVTPVVSADRRYVRMSLSPLFIGPVQFDTFSVPAAVTGGGGLGGGGLGGLGGFGGGGGGLGGGLGGGGGGAGFRNMGPGGRALSGFQDPNPLASFAMMGQVEPQRAAPAPRATKGRRTTATAKRRSR